MVSSIGGMITSLEGCGCATSVIGQSVVVLAHDGGADLAGFRRGVAEAGNETWEVEHDAETHMVSPLANGVCTGRDLPLTADQRGAVRAWREHPDEPSTWEDCRRPSVGDTRRRRKTRKSGGV